MAICSNCGATTPDGERFCGNCGRPLIPSAEGPTSNPNIPPQPSRIGLPPPPPGYPTQGSNPIYPRPSFGNQPQPQAQITPAFPAPGPSGLAYPPQGNLPPNAPGVSGLGTVPMPSGQIYSAQGNMGVTPPPASNNPLFLASNAPVNPTPSNMMGTGTTYPMQPMQGQGPGSALPPQMPPAQKPRRSPWGRILIISLVILLLIASVAITAIVLKNQPNTQTSNGTQVAGTPTSQTVATATQAQAPTDTPTTAVTATTDTTTPTATATTATTGDTIVPKSPKLPLSLTCVSGCDNKFALVLTSINVDQQAQTSTAWNFTLTNETSGGCTNVGFATLTLEDSSGNLYKGQGQVSDTFNMSNGQVIQTSPDIPAIPQQGTLYKLNVEMRGNCANGADNIYQTESFTF